MAEQATAPVSAAPASADVTSIIAETERVMDRFVSGLDARVSALTGTGRELGALHDSFAAGGTSAAALLLKIFVVVAVTVGVLLLCRRWFRSPDAGAWRRLFSVLAAAILAVVAGVVAQRLLPSQTNGDAKRRVACSEILINTPAIANLIATGKSAQIYSSMETGSSLGMQTLEQDLARLWVTGRISEFTATAMARNPSVMRDRATMLRAPKIGGGK